MASSKVIAEQSFCSQINNEFQQQHNDVTGASSNSDSSDGEECGRRSRVDSLNVFHVPEERVSLLDLSELVVRTNSISNAQSLHLSSASSSASSGDDDEMSNNSTKLNSQQQQQQQSLNDDSSTTAKKRKRNNKRDNNKNGKSKAEFRRYCDELESIKQDPIQQRVRQTYYAMHKNMTVEFVRSKLNKWTKFNHAELTIMEALIKLNALVDESDPDSNLPNIVHAFQTAERIRAVHPNDDWLQLTGLIHDLGKVMALWGEEQWAVVGDTFPVGCKFADAIVYRKHSFDENPDLKDARYNTKYGIYKPNCGLDNVLFSWGHDEYMFRVLKNHKACKLPEAALKIIKLHSFYPWHRDNEYMHLCSRDDIEIKPIIDEFNKFDLYTKSEAQPDIEALLPYYQGLIDKYIPGKVKW